MKALTPRIEGRGSGGKGHVDRLFYNFPKRFRRFEQSYINILQLSENAVRFVVTVPKLLQRMR